MSTTGLIVLSGAAVIFLVLIGGLLWRVEKGRQRHGKSDQPSGAAGAFFFGDGGGNDAGGGGGDGGGAGG